MNNGNLIFKGISTEEGKDSLGRWTIEKYTFVPDKFMDIIFNVMFKVYRDHPTLLFGQVSMRKVLIHLSIYLDECISVSLVKHSVILFMFPGQTLN